MSEHPIPLHPLLLTGGQVLLPDGGLTPADVLVAGGRILAVGPDAIGMEEDRMSMIRLGLVRMNLGGRLLLPGIIDVHGDAFEHVIQPRPETTLPLPLALEETDAELAANGVTTAYFGLTWTWEAGRATRTGDGPRRFLDAFDAARPHMRCDCRLHLRFEIHNLEALDTAAKWLSAGRVDLLAFNDHLEYLESKEKNPAKLAARAAANGMSPADFLAVLRARHEHLPQARRGVERLAALARKRGLPMASHDDSSPETRRRYAGLGCRICEFPTDEATLREALDLGSAVVLGAPNALRGGSIYGRISARGAALAGRCSILASDYAYPAPLAAALDLWARHGLPLGRAWDLVSARPAAALGLKDRGRIAPGLRADLIAVGKSPLGGFRAAAAWVAGRLVHAGPGLADAMERERSEGSAPSEPPAAACGCIRRENLSPYPETGTA